MRSLFSFVLLLTLGCASSPAVTLSPDVPQPPSIACKATPTQAQALIEFDPDGENQCMSLSAENCTLVLDFVRRCKASVRYWNTRK